MREWNSYAVEDIISAFTLTPLLPYWYVAMGMCDGNELHWNCPEDWSETKDQWFSEETREMEEGSDHEEGEHEEDYEIWEEGEEGEEGSDGEENPEDAEIEEPEDQFGL